MPGLSREPLPLRAPPGRPTKAGTPQGQAGMHVTCPQWRARLAHRPRLSEGAYVRALVLLPLSLLSGVSLPPPLSLSVRGTPHLPQTPFLIIIVYRSPGCAAPGPALHLSPGTFSSITACRPQEAGCSRSPPREKKLPPGPRPGNLSETRRGPGGSVRATAEMIIITMIMCGHTPHAR